MASQLNRGLPVRDQEWCEKCGHDPDECRCLTLDEQRAVRSLQRLAKKWPRSLMLFCGGCGLTVRKPELGKFYGDEYTVASISGIPCDGGDGDREHCADDIKSIPAKGTDPCATPRANCGCDDCVYTRSVPARGTT